MILWILSGQQDLLIEVLFFYSENLILCLSKYFTNCSLFIAPRFMAPNFGLTDLNVNIFLIKPLCLIMHYAFMKILGVPKYLAIILFVIFSVLIPMNILLVSNVLGFYFGLTIVTALVFQLLSIILGILLFYSVLMI